MVEIGDEMVAMITLFLCGDLMSGRGIDQVLPQSNEASLFESYVRDARVYVTLAERVNGEIFKPMSYRDVWGDALEVLEDVRPDVRVVNLETAVTTSDDHWPGKGIHYRMHPANVELLKVAGVDCCVLANNHVLDWGRAGLEETLKTLREAGLAVAGAGRNEIAAAAPVVLAAGGLRVMVFAAGTASAGVSRAWAATLEGSGVHYLSEVSRKSAGEEAARIRGQSRPEDVVVYSIHWGSNWGYDVPAEQVAFAHALIDSGTVDVVHGHSSHHPRPIEIYKGKLILYGAGDFLNDYEGIEGEEQFRGDLTLMYFPRIDPATGNLLRLEMAPMQIHRFSLRRASPEDAAWLRDTLERESRELGTRVHLVGAWLEVTGAPGR